MSQEMVFALSVALCLVQVFLFVIHKKNLQRLERESIANLEHEKEKLAKTERHLYKLGLRKQPNGEWK